MDTVPPPCELVGVFPSQRALAESQAEALNDERLPATFVGDLVIRDNHAYFLAAGTGTAYCLTAVLRSETPGQPVVRAVAIRALMRELTIENRLTEGRHLSFGYARVEAYLSASEPNVASERRFLLIGKKTARAALEVLETFLRSHSISLREPTIPAPCSSAVHAPV